MSQFYCIIVEKPNVLCYGASPARRGLDAQFNQLKNWGARSGKDGPFAYAYDHVFPDGLLPGGHFDVTDVSLHFWDLQRTTK